MKKKMSDKVLLSIQKKLIPQLKLIAAKILFFCGIIAVLYLYW